MAWILQPTIILQRFLWFSSFGRLVFGSLEWILPKSDHKHIKISLRLSVQLGLHVCQYSLHKTRILSCIFIKNITESTTKYLGKHFCQDQWLHFHYSYKFTVSKNVMNYNVATVEKLLLSYQQIGNITTDEKSPKD